MIQIAGISSMATRQILADLAQDYELRSGCRVAFTSIGGVEAERRLCAGEVVDVVVLASKVMKRLEAEGHIMPGSCEDFAASGMAVAVRSGTGRPSIRDEAAVKEAMLSARAICYSTGPSGHHLKKLWERWGIADRISQRAIQAPPGGTRRHSSRPWGGSSGLSAAERVDAPAKHRCARSFAARNSINDHIYCRSRQRIKATGSSPRARWLSDVTGGGSYKTPIRHGTRLARSIPFRTTGDLLHNHADGIVAIRTTWTHRYLLVLRGLHHHHVRN
jgi:hypothetical protein